MHVEYKDKVFLPCMAHQMNLVLVIFLKNQKNIRRFQQKQFGLLVFFIWLLTLLVILRDKQLLIYNKTIALLRPEDTCWNSYYFCFHSLLKTEATLKVFKIFIFYIYYIINIIIII